MIWRQVVLITLWIFSLTVSAQSAGLPISSEVRFEGPEPGTMINYKCSTNVSGTTRMTNSTVIIVSKTKKTVRRDELVGGKFVPKETVDEQITLVSIDNNNSMFSKVMAPWQMASKAYLKITSGNTSSVGFMSSGNLNQLERLSSGKKVTAVFVERLTDHGTQKQTSKEWVINAQVESMEEVAISGGRRLKTYKIVESSTESKGEKMTFTFYYSPELKYAAKFGYSYTFGATALVVSCTAENAFVGKPF